jgi:small subunit ribosomal protein S17
MACSVRPGAFRPAQLSSAAARPVAPVQPARPDMLAFAKKAMEGRVVSSKMDKTATVIVSRYQIVDKRYGKRVLRTKKYHVHDEANACEEGDVVAIRPAVKVSKTKTFTLDRIIRKVIKL